MLKAHFAEYPRRAPAVLAKAMEHWLWQYC